MTLDMEDISSIYDDDDTSGDAQQSADNAEDKPTGEPKDVAADEGNSGSEMPESIEELATELGFDEDEIKLFKAKGTLEKRVTEAAKAQGRLEAEEPENKKPAPKKEAEEQIKLEGFPEFETEGDDAYDPKIVQLAKAAKSQIQALHKVREQLEGELNHIRLVQAVSRFDRLVAEAPKEYLEELGGAVDTEDLEVNSKAYQNRVKLFKEIELQREIHQKRGEPISGRQLFRKSLDATLGKKGHSDVISELLKKRKITSVNKPAPRRAPATPDQQTSQVLARIAERAGIPVGEDSDADPFL